jgi:hypothetical protein
MKLTVSVSFAQRAAEAIGDNRSLRNTLERTHTNVWEFGDDECVEFDVTCALDAAGIPSDEYESKL